LPTGTRPIAILFKRFVLLVGGFQIANLDMTGPLTPLSTTNWDAGMANAFSSLVYTPSVVELLARVIESAAKAG
jgi:hypothetical protein